MSVNNLRNYNWEQGTQASPVLLTGAEFNKLTTLIEESNRVGSNINADIRGWVQVGQNITSYQKYLAELAKDGQGNPLLHVVNTQVDPVSYAITPQSNSIKEGTSTKLNINGIGLEALKFRIVNHTNDTPDYQARTTIDTELGYVRVAPAQENTTWTDVVTIQTCPVWEEWTDQGASIVEFDVTVNATAVTSVTITAPQYVKPGVTFNPIVNFLPVGHTKPIVNTLEDAGAKRGICFVPTSDDFNVGKTTDPTKMSAIAPSTETPVGETWSLGCGVYAFTSAQTMATPSVNVVVKYPYIQFTITTNGTFSDISTVNPKITLQKVDSEDTPIGEPVVLSGKPIPDVNPTSLVYTYGEGNVAGDGSETYQINVEKVSGYRASFVHKITPNDVSNNVSITYTYLVPGIYVIYNDDTEEDYDTIYSRNFRPLEGLTPKFIAVITSSYSFIIEPLDTNITMKMTPISTRVPNIPYTVDDMDGENNTDKMITFFGTNVEDTDMYAPLMARNSKITVGGNDIIGYIPSYGQLTVLKDNKGNVNNLIVNTFNKATVFPNKYTGTTTYDSETSSFIKCIDSSGTMRAARPTDSFNIHIFYPY